jgi:predicted PhzF superfamily epimerase YddE/YHI9
VPEDPVTGSAHCTLVPYWAQRLAKKQLHAVQVSQRMGELFCELRQAGPGTNGERVRMGGHAVTYMEGIIHVDPDYVAPRKAMVAEMAAGR